jgi:hypothetical protein
MTAPQTSMAPKDALAERLHMWIDRADRQLAADRHPQGVLEDLLEELEQLAADLGKGETR